MFGKSWIQILHDFANAQYWIKAKQEDRMAGKYCERLDGYVDADFQDCGACQLCTNSTR